MSNETKHKVTTDALQTLGTLIGDTEKRDAIHLAVEPVIAGELLRPGDHVGFLPDGTAGDADEKVGIVDPFLTGKVRKGQRFWLIVYPRQITSLRHVWEHPKFPSSELSSQISSTSKNPASEAWIRQFADNVGVEYEELLSRARDFAASGDYWSEGGRFEGEWTPDEFWDHYENVTGEKVAADDRGGIFSCSC